MSVFWQYRTVREGGARGVWRIITTRYEYLLVRAAEREMLAYHWHPQVSVAFPHLHLHGGITPLSHKTHLPTGFVSLGAVVRLLITEFSVPPLRNDWETVLDIATPRPESP